MPDPQPRTPGEVLSRMKRLADEAGIVLEPGTTYQNLKASADRAEYVLNVIYNTVCYELNHGRIPDIWFKGDDAAWLQSAMRGDAPFQARYNEALAGLKREGIVIDFEKVGRDAETSSEVLRVVVEPVPEPDAAPSPSVGM